MCHIYNVGSIKQGCQIILQKKKVTNKLYNASFEVNEKGREEGKDWYGNEVSLK